MSLKIRQLLTPLALPVVMTALSILAASFTGQPVQQAAAESNGVVLVSSSRSSTLSPKSTSSESSSRGYLGVSCQRLRANLREVLEVPEGVSGVLISDVVNDSPADKAGLRNRDIVLKMNGEPIDDEREFTQLIRSAGAGTDIRLSVWRAGQTLELHPTLAVAPGEHRDYSWSWSSDDEEDSAPRRGRGWNSWNNHPMPSIPATPPMPPMPPEAFEAPDTPEPFEMLEPGKFSMAWNSNHARLGVMLQELTPEIAPFFNAPNAEGALVWQVVEDSPAEKAGFRAGDVIVEVEGKSIDNINDLHEALARYDGGDKAAVTVLRRGQSTSLSVTFDEGNQLSGAIRNRILSRMPSGSRGWATEPSAPRARREARPPMEDLQRQMERLQRQMEELQSKLDRLKD